MNACPHEQFRLKSCPKSYMVDQDKAAYPLTTVNTAMEKLNHVYDLSNVKLVRRKDAVDGAFSYSSISDQMQTSGKSLTPEQAQASAIMEFVERYSWFHFDYEGYPGYSVCSFNEMKNRKVKTVDEDYFLNNFLRQEDGAALLEAIKNIPLKWIKGLKLNDYTDYYYPINWHNYTFTSNGLAAGNAMEEAILQGICELVERENVCRFLGDRRQGRDLELSDIKNSFICRILENADAAGIKFLVKDISFDFGIPTFVVQGTNEQERGKVTYKGCGYGTHLNPEKALIRALAEYFESYSLILMQTQGMELNWKAILERMPARNYAFIVNLGADMFTESGNKINLKDMPALNRSDFRDEIELALKILKKHGHEVCLIDKTCPTLGIPAVRVFSAHAQFNKCPAR